MKDEMKKFLNFDLILKTLGSPLLRPDPQARSVHSHPKRKGVF